MFQWDTRTVEHPVNGAMFGFAGADTDVRTSSALYDAPAIMRELEKLWCCGIS
jgi:hypothetical protein